MAKETQNLVDVGRMAQEFRCSERQVQLFVASGMPKAGHGKYDVLLCYRWYSQKLEKDVADAQDHEGDLEYEQMRERRATADIKELELAEKRGQLIPVETYRAHVAQHFTTVRQNILAVASQIAPQLEGLDRLEIKQRLQAKHRDVLSAMSKGETEDAAPGSAAGQDGDGSGDRAPTDSGRAGDDGAAGRVAGTDAGSKGRAGKGGPRTKGAAGSATGRKHKRVGRSKPGAAKRNK